MEYTLKWSGRNDSPVVQMAFTYCKKEITICKDICQFISFEEYEELVASGKIEKPTSYWKIEPGQVGMICYASYARSYQSSWEHLDNCYRDFIAGYNACENGYKFLRDWDETLEHEAKRNKFLKKCKRSFIFTVDCWENSYHPIMDPNTSKVTYYQMRNGSWKFSVVDNCTGPELENLVYSICYNCRIPMPTMEIDPRKEETKRYY